jgi:hypothetical protein
MKINYLRSYRKKDTGRLVFVYTVSGTTAQLAAYKTAMGDKHTVDESGTPLWFTIRFVGKSGSLIMTSENKVIADTSAFDQAQSLVEQYQGALGQEIAKQLVGQLLGNGPAKAVSAPADTKAIDK